MIIANMATYPDRQSSTLQVALSSIAEQVDIVNLCLNQYMTTPEFLDGYDNVNAYIPDQDYKDVGKFLAPMKENDDVFYVDDDIVYPPDYVTYSSSIHEKYAKLSPIVGYHGTIYSDVFDGHHASRNVFSFRTRLHKARVVNQLGTGTVHCKGWQTPTADFMKGSERFVDVRFAIHAKNNNYPMICAPREAKWLHDQEPEDSIFEGFTKGWPISVIQEAQGITGYGNLPLRAVSVVEVS